MACAGAGCCCLLGLEVIWGKSCPGLDLAQCSATRSATGRAESLGFPRVRKPLSPGSRFLTWWWLDRLGSSSAPKGSPGTRRPSFLQLFTD